MKNRNLDHSDNWRTPPEFYKLLNEEFNFDFDPCPLNESEITPDKDGLLIDWGKVNYINPPYSQKLKESFINKSIEECKKGNVCVLLLPVSTSTKVFHELILPNASEIRYIKGRVPFIGTNDKGQKVNHHLIQEVTKETIIYDGEEKPLYVKNSGQHDSMIVIFKPSELHTGAVAGN